LHWWFNAQAVRVEIIAKHDRLLHGLSHKTLLRPASCVPRPAAALGAEFDPVELAIGASRLQLVDFDRVHRTNVTTQGFVDDEGLRAACPQPVLWRIELDGGNQGIASARPKNG
jgi:hypothetical protein